VIYHNATTEALRFEIRDMKFVVPPGAQCDIPAPLAWVVESRGLRLTRGASPDPKADHVEATAVTPEKRPMPSGVKSERFATVDEEEEGDEDLDASEAAAPVAEAVAKLQKQGVTPPGQKRK